MLQGPLHDRGPYGRCTACGEPFPCPTGLAIFENVTRQAPHWEDLEDREARCPKCLHWWVSHGVSTEENYGCGIPTSSMDERERGIFEVCGCAFAEGNTVTPRQVRIWHDGTSDPTPPWERERAVV